MSSASPRLRAARVLVAVALSSVACGEGAQATDATTRSSDGTADGSTRGSSEGSEGSEADASSEGTGATTEATEATATTAATDDPTDETGAPDQLPPTPTLASPEDGATEVPIVSELCWSPVEDPDGEPLRYRVFVNGRELAQGLLGDEGYEGPCTGPLNLVHETTYTWQVQAFEVDDPTRSSPKSAAWSFTSAGDGLTGTVFEDTFETDLGWQVSGGASAGAWVRASPVAAHHDGALSQPPRCLGGGLCYITGQNPESAPDDEDVVGVTVLTSPPFSLAGAQAATVQLRRFFYKSAQGPGPALTIELLTPNPDADDGYDAHLLERLDQPTSAAPENLWTPREYAVCDAPLTAGARLRVTAEDPGVGVLEAAIDAVSVHAHATPAICGAGEGAFCDPQGLTCPNELLCCAQGVVNDGVHRCAAPVPGLDFESPPPSPDDPGNGPLGCDAPDLIVDGAWIDPIFTDILVDQDTCEWAEGCLGWTGWRSLMLFTVATPNVGARDLVMGIPANHPELYHYSDCHDHYHFDDFARYELRAGDEVIAPGHKQAFCMLDTASWAWGLAQPKFDCANQGISRGFSDFYDAGLPCQWIDITDVPPGDYTLRVSLNQPPSYAALPTLNERDYANNTLEVPVTIP